MSGVDPISIGMNLADDIINKIWPDPADRAKADVMEAQAKITAYVEEVVKPQLAQVAVDQAEAGSGNWFAADWRPFVGWVCGVGFAYTFIIQPFGLFVARLFGWTGQPPVVETATMMQLLLGMLGLGGLHVYQAVKTGQQPFPDAPSAPTAQASGGVPWKR